LLAHLFASLRLQNWRRVAGRKDQNQRRGLGRRVPNKTREGTAVTSFAPPAAGTRHTHAART
jgi:hypothetical protein